MFCDKMCCRVPVNRDFNFFFFVYDALIDCVFCTFIFFLTDYGSIGQSDTISEFTVSRKI